jgi:multicomponent Na+:H+ antiporter subunit D
MNIHLPILILLIPIAAVPLCVLLSFLSQKISEGMGFLFLVLTLGLEMAASLKVVDQGPWHYQLGGWPPPWGIELTLTSFPCLMGGISLLVLLVCWFYSRLFSFASSGDKGSGSFFLLFAAGFLGLLLIRDAFSLYLLLELLLLSGAALLAGQGGRGWLNGFYLLLGGSAGASLYFAALFFLFSATGTLHLDDLLAQLFIFKNNSTAILSGLLVAAAFLFPLGFVHPVFLGRQMNRISPFVLGLLSSVMARVMAYLLFLFLFFVLAIPGLLQPPWLVGLEYLLVLGFLVHFVFAVKQKDLFHAVAYLSLGQLGFLFLGFMVGNKGALTGSLLEIVNQILIAAGLFVIAGSLRTGPGAHLVSRLAGLARYRPFTGLALIVMTASIAGVPPTAGFFGKFYLAQGALEKKDWVVLGLLGITVLFNFFFFARFTAFLYEHRGPSLSYGSSSLLAQAPFLLLAIGILLLGLFHQFLIHDFIEPSLPKGFQNIPVPNVPFLGHQVE